MSRALRRTASPAYHGLTMVNPSVNVCSACLRGLLARRRPGSALLPWPHRAAPTWERTFIAPARSRGRVSQFEDMVESQFRQIAPSRKSWSEVKHEFGAFGVKDMAHLRREENAFKRAIRSAFDMAEVGRLGSKENSLFESLRLAFIRGDVKGLASQLHYLFRNFLLRNQFSKPVTDIQRQLADLRYPWEWFPATRGLQRTIHLHVGPTNSGKTYHALQALENAKSGVYCGPLRLLAHEVYSRLNAKGKACALLTGEEQRYPEDTDQFYISCTVEMTPMHEMYDVAVIDEIQMLADPDRGPAWTAALLGVQAKEVHLCGEERTVQLVQSLCASIGDACVVHRYERLTPLKAASRAIGKTFENLEKGDCIVAFSRVAIHAMKVNIERRTGRRCAIIYGGLPPETRAQQAALFNDPDNDYDFLVASDAIGMGLNLEIKRVVFESVTKHDGYDWRNLTVSEVRQIGGRAGRYKSAREAIIKSSGELGGQGAVATADPKDEVEKVGYVTTLDQLDLPLIQNVLWKDAKQISSAYISPPVAYVERFASYFSPTTSLSFILMRMRELATLSDRFQLNIKDASLAIADAIQEYPLSIYDRLVLITAPVSLRSYGGLQALQAVARCIAERKGGHILDMEEMHLELLGVDYDTIPKWQQSMYLQHLEALHLAVVLYLWVSYRFPRIFTAQALAFHIRNLVQEKINVYLSSMNFAEDDVERRRRQHRLKALKRDRMQKDLLGSEGVESVSMEGGAGRWEEEGHEEPLADAPEDLLKLGKTTRKAAP